MWPSLLVSLTHGAVALAWVVGLRRFAHPLPPSLWADLLAMALTIPVLTTSLVILGVPGPFAQVLRVDLWSAVFQRSGTTGVAALLLLTSGVGLLSIFQEVIPVARSLLKAKHERVAPDARLELSLRRVQPSFARLGLLGARYGGTRILRLEVERPTAVLRGLVLPYILVSRGLLAQLDDEELDAVVAHELGHMVRGGNLRMLLFWLLRMLQLPNPAALVVFRELVEAQEVACDALAARVTGRPAALASALLKAQTRLPPELRGSAAARLRERADTFATRLRVRALLDSPVWPIPPRRSWVAALLALFLMLWGIR